MDLNNYVLFLKQQFYKMNIANATSLKEHLNAINILVQQLSALKIPPGNNDKKAILLNSLEDHAKYAKVLGGLCIAREMRYDEVVAHILDHEHQCLQTSHMEDKIMVGQVHTTKPSFSKASTLTLHCTYSKETDHTANCCFKCLDDLVNKHTANYVKDTPA